MRKPLAITALLGLAACSGAPAVSPTLPIANGTVLIGTNADKLTGDVPSNLPNGTAAPIQFNNAPVGGVIKTSALQTGSFGGAQKIAASGNTFDVVAFSDDGVSTLGQTSIISATTIGASAGSGVGTGMMQVARYNRQTNSVLPTQGSGTFTGLYRGTIGSPSGNPFMGYAGNTIIATQGNLTLTADFVGKTIGGSITNHKSLLANGVTGPDNLGDVTLTQTAITGSGSFISNASSSQATGTYEGLIGGPNGTGVAGALKLTTTTGGLSELGVFTGKRP